GQQEFALTKMVTTHPIKNYIEHVDLLLVSRGEKVAVDIPVVVHGEAATGALVYQELNTVSVEADALNIPAQLEVSVEEARVGTQITAAQLRMPGNATLLTDPEALVVHVVAAPTAEEMESEIDTEGAGVVEDESEGTGEAAAAPGEEIAAADEAAAGGQR
ncbi:MAG: 50S ribosomal protein L25, partial [Sciscionella sp.]